MIVKRKSTGSSDRRENQRNNIEDDMGMCLDRNKYHFYEELKSYMYIVLG